MATIVNAPAAAHEDTGTGISLLVGVLLILAIAFLLFFFGLPVLRNLGTSSTPQQINTNNLPQVRMPDKVDVNINPNGGAPAP